MSKSERRDFEERYTACFNDFALKTVTGILIGSMFGGFFLRGYRRWPTYIGGGLGFGMAYNNCEHSLNSYLLSKEPKVCVMNSILLFVGLCLIWSAAKSSLVSFETFLFGFTSLAFVTHCNAEETLRRLMAAVMRRVMMMVH